jgi:predicted  nucleic acid-binding Zn-ribbon protein
VAWYRNHYTCTRCDYTWTDEWSCMCDDDCPECGARHMSPYDSEDLTEVVEPVGDEFIVLWSPETAEHEPDYCELGTFSSRAEAEAFLASDQYSARPHGG